MFVRRSTYNDAVRDAQQWRATAYAELERSVKLTDQLTEREEEIRRLRQEQVADRNRQSELEGQIMRLKHGHST